MQNKIAICVPTCGGPFLGNCIESLFNSNNKGFDLVVVFNGDVKNFDNFKIPDRAPFDIQVDYVPESGVVFVRNFFLDYCFKKNNYDYLIMLDDDQIVESDWFGHLSNVVSCDKYDVIGSYVKPYFYESIHQIWMNELNVYYLHKRETGPVEMIHGTGGTVFSKRIYGLLNCSFFDDTFAATGGEDSDFFVRAKMNGAKFYRSKEAVCFETIDRFRSAKEWAKKRYFRIGYCDAKLNKKYKKDYLFYIIALLSYFIYMALSGIHLDDNKRIKYKCLQHRQSGKLSFLFGFDKKFYSKAV